MRTPHGIDHRHAPNVRVIHATFTAIYTILAAIFLAAPILFVRYELIFQSGLMGFMIGIAFLMLSATLWGKELCQCQGSFYILDRHTIGIMICSVAAFLFTAFYIWNVANILLMCPRFDVRTDTTLDAQTEITFAVSYMAPDRGMMRRQTLNLKYDAQEKSIIREQRNNPLHNTPEELNMESFRYEMSRLHYREKHRAWLQTLKSAAATEETTTNDDLQFYMLRNEIAMLLEEASRPYEHASGFSVRSLVPLQTTNLEEDEQFQEARAAKVCRNEKGFGIFLLCVLILCQILYIVTICVYAWLKSWMACLCPLRIPHTPSCRFTATKTTLAVRKPYFT